MAEILLCIKDGHHDDPVEDLADMPKRGYAISIKEDGTNWGRLSDIRKFLAEGNSIDDWHGATALILIPTVPVADVNYLVESLWDILYDPNSGEDRNIRIRKRNWKCNIDLLPVPIRNKIDREFIYEATLAQWNAVVEYIGV